MWMGVVVVEDKPMADQSGRRHATTTNHAPSLLGQDVHGAVTAEFDKATRPRQLLELPVEILNAILKEACCATAVLAYIKLTCRNS
jgi:hypothetical protein